MTFHLRYISYLFLLNLILLSDDRIFFDLDPIENNQILLNSYNTNILDTLSFRSIIFNQNHHLPYGTFIFNDITDLSEIDTTSHISQFVHKKGDFRYRDLIISLNKKNDNDVKYQFVGQNRSYTPLSINEASGSNFLQNFLIDIHKKTESNYIASTIVYHKENPTLPISYNFNSADQGVYNTRLSQSIIWGFHVKKIFNDKINIEFKNSNQFSFLKNKYNISEDGYNETWNSFSNQYFTVWNNFKANYRINNSVEIKTNFSSEKQRQFYQDFDINSDLDSLHFNFNIFRALTGIQIKKYFFGLNILGIDTKENNYIDEEGFSSNYHYNTNNLYFIFRPYILAELINKNSFSISLTHTYEDVFYDLPVDDISQDQLYQIPILYLMNNNISMKASKNFFDSELSIGHIAVSDVSISNYNYSRYFYYDIDIKYHRKYFSAILGFNGYVDEKNSDNILYSPKINSYSHYLISYKMPIKNKTYSLLFKVNGRFTHLKNGSFNLNTLPMITNELSGQESKIIHYMDISGSLEFEKFTISYHNITNNGNDFSLESPFSDIGSSFSLPQYSFLGSELSIFHYLKISWTFID